MTEQQLRAAVAEYDAEMINAIKVAMLRGEIAVPPLAELLHVYGTTFSDLDEANIELAKARETIRQLNKEIDDLIKTDNETIRSLFAYQAKRDETIRQLRAQLDEYEQAPTVATVGHHYADTYRIFGTPPPIGTELIARPTRKDGE